MGLGLGPWCHLQGDDQEDSSQLGLGPKGNWMAWFGLIYLNGFGFLKELGPWLVEWVLKKPRFRFGAGLALMCWVFLMDLNQFGWFGRPWSAWVLVSRLSLYQWVPIRPKAKFG